MLRLAVVLATCVSVCLAVGVVVWLPLAAPGLVSARSVAEAAAYDVPVTCTYSPLSMSLTGTGSVGDVRPFDTTVGDSFLQFGPVPPITATAASSGAVLLNSGFTGNVGGDVIGWFNMLSPNGFAVNNSTLGPEARGYQANELVVSNTRGTLTLLIAYNFAATTASPPYYPRTISGYIQSTDTTGVYAPFKFAGTITGTMGAPSGGNVPFTASIQGRLYTVPNSFIQFSSSGSRSLPASRGFSPLTLDTIAQFRASDFAAQATNGTINPTSVFRGRTSTPVSGTLEIAADSLLVGNSLTNSPGWLVSNMRVRDAQGDEFYGPFLADLPGVATHGYFFQVGGTGIYSDSLIFGMQDGAISYQGGEDWAGGLVGYHCQDFVPANFTPTPTPTAIVTPAPQVCVVIEGSITMTDSIQTGMLNQVGTPSVCDFTPRPNPGQADTLQRHRDTYVYYFPFGSFSTQCVTVNITPTGCPGNLFSVAYANGAYAGDLGTVPSDGGEYSFTSYRGQSFSVVVHEVTPNTGCSSYTLTLSSSVSCSSFTQGTPTPTWTPTATATSTPMGVATTATPITPTQSPIRTPTFTTQTPTRTPALTQTATATGTATKTNTPRPPTQTPGGGTATAMATGTVASTSTPCPLTFTDVPPEHPFHTWIGCLACRGIVSGYADGTFLPGNGITRGQIAKVVAEAAGFAEDAGPQAYEDVPPGSTFYAYINRLSIRGLVGGYACGQVPGEQCVGPANRPYFRPNAGATRGQLAKIVATAAGINEPVAGQFYADVASTNAFYVWIERLTGRGVMGGYPCGGRPGEPCDEGDRPYFRWAADITRGQASKIVSNTFFAGCLGLDRR